MVSSSSKYQVLDILYHVPSVSTKLDPNPNDKIVNSVIYCIGMIRRKEKLLELS